MSAPNLLERDAVFRRIRLAELSSSAGAGILGLGIGVLTSPYLAGLSIVAVGLLLHSWGMTDRHQMEAKQRAPRVWWSTLLYWICWVSLAGLAAYVVWTKV